MTKAQLQGKSSTDEKDSSAGKIEKPVERSQESPLLPPHLLIKAPPIVTASNIQALQRAVGNRAVMRVLEPSTTVVQRELDEQAVLAWKSGVASQLKSFGHQSNKANDTRRQAEDHWQQAANTWGQQLHPKWNEFPSSGGGQQEEAGTTTEGG